MGNGGFTIFETMVVVGIMVAVSSLILANYPGFNERLGVSRVSEEIASAVRQTQAYGLGVKESGTGSGIFPGYGLYFQSASPGSYIFFADRNGNLQYDTGEEKISEINIAGGVQIADLCANQKQATVGPCSLSNLTALYLRPQPQVTLKSGGLSYADIEIKIRGLRGTTKTIILWLSGQVSIE
jgi:type II secretory pathway pseudopilin PulG